MAEKDMVTVEVAAGRAIKTKDGMVTAGGKARILASQYHERLGKVIEGKAPEKPPEPVRKKGRAAAEE